MASFISVPALQYHSGRNPWRLMTKMVYQSDEPEIRRVFPHGLIEVPKGYHTDLASVPRLPFIHMAFGNRAHMPAIIHDYLYDCCTDKVSRKVADLCFLEAMKVSGYPARRRYAMYAGVRLGGWYAWRKNGKQKCIVGGA